MKCPKCQTENPDTGKFCRECGAKLVLVCPQCGAENLPGDKFCGECGHSIDELTTIQEEKPLPAAESERKYVTILFSDLSGYTAMSEKLDPEELNEIMGRIFVEIEADVYLKKARGELASSR
jgi:ribosomal protein L40E